jgi:hypothetical protein
MVYVSLVPSPIISEGYNNPQVGMVTILALCMCERRLEFTSFWRSIPERSWIFIAVYYNTLRHKIQ